MSNILQGALQILAQVSGAVESDPAAPAATSAATLSDTASVAATSAPPLLDSTVQQLSDGGMLHFIAQSDFVGKSLFVILRCCRFRL